MEAGLVTRHPVVHLGIQHATRLAFVMLAHAELGLPGLHALVVQELELELALLALFAALRKPKPAVPGIVQQVLTLTALDAHNQ